MEVEVEVDVVDVVDVDVVDLDMEGGLRQKRWPASPAMGCPARTAQQNPAPVLRETSQRADMKVPGPWRSCGIAQRGAYLAYYPVPLEVAYPDTAPCTYHLSSYRRGTGQLGGGGGAPCQFSTQDR